MKLTYGIPFILGAAAILQAGLNRMVAAQSTLPVAVLVNTGVLVILAGGFFWFHVRSGPGPEFTSLPWYALIPGIMGFSLVAGLPFAISRIGALQTFIVFVTGQLFFSLLWDRWVENIPITSSRIVALALTCAGVLLAIRR